MDDSELLPLARYWKGQAQEKDSEIAGLHNQIDRLASVLLSEQGGPTQSESACEMAVRLLREKDAEIAALKEERDRLREMLREVMKHGLGVSVKALPRTTISSSTLGVPFIFHGPKLDRWVSTIVAGDRYATLAVERTPDIETGEIAIGNLLAYYDPDTGAQVFGVTVKVGRAFVYVVKSGRGTTRVTRLTRRHVSAIYSAHRPACIRYASRALRFGRANKITGGAAAGLRSAIASMRGAQS